MPDDTGEMSEPPSSIITPEEAKEALQASGYLLEKRVAHALEEKGFYVETNTFRQDPRDPDRSIEVDVWGGHMVSLGDAPRSFVGTQPFIECKNNSQPVAFFLKTQPVRELNDNHIKYGGFPVSSADPGTASHVALHKLLEMKDWHHYCGTHEVATQFCTFSRPEEQQEEKKKTLRNRWKWKASKPEDMKHYRQSFSDLCAVVEHEGLSAGSLDEERIEIEFYYPIVVFQGPIYAVRVSGANVDVTEADHLQFHHSTSAHRQILSAQIDVVSERAFPALIEEIVRETSRVAKVIKKGFYERLLASAVDQKRVATRRGEGRPIDLRGLAFG